MKKTIILLVVIVFSFSSWAQEIQWVGLEEAIELQKKSPRKIIMDVYTNWCGPCKLLDNRTFQNPDVANYVNKYYYAVKFNGEGNELLNYKNKQFGNPNYDPARKNSRNSVHELARYLQVSAYPTIVFMDEKAEVIAPITGYKTPEQLELYLKMFKKDDHKKITTQEEFSAYYKAFTPVFNGG
ncbi:thioredoxin family protein [Cognatitamlana onchidii]|uniref:thioredoxin family protein n=1 Tax=Cognatitamlana onchidii TaxID=2562860 RepID=UPI0010A62B53|nr:thioredoxin fold domain-containing protein [Algibacter onchidii]